MKNVILRVSFVMLILFFLLSSVSYGTVTINFLNFFDNQPDIIYIADLDLLQTGNAPLLFQLAITSTVPLDTPHLRISLYDGSNTLIARGFVKRNRVLNPGEPWHISNLDISRRNYDASWEVQENLDRFQSQVLRTGTVPIDTYTFLFEVGTGSNKNFPAIPNTAQRTITIRGMGYVQLRYPPHDPSGASPLPTNLPFFVWQTNLNHYHFQLAELMPNESPSSAIESRRIIDEPVTGNSYQYPAYGVLPLQPGRQYVWRVAGIVTTSRGNVPVTSETNVFKIANQLTPSVQQLMIALSQLLSGGNWSSILQMVQAGQLNGDAYMNNQPITAQTIFALIGQISAGEASIRSVRVE